MSLDSEFLAFVAQVDSGSPTAVYKFFDSDQRLLYVGLTNNLPARFGEHEGDKPWWQRVARVEVIQMPDRVSALALEYALIRLERPEHNKMHVSVHPRSFTPRTEASVALLGGTSGKVKERSEWLVDALRLVGGSSLQVVIMLAASQQGWSESQMRTARTSSRDPAVRAVKKGSSWYWELDT